MYLKLLHIFIAAIEPFESYHIYVLLIINRHIILNEYKVLTILDQDVLNYRSLASFLWDICKQCKHE